MHLYKLLEKNMKQKIIILFTIYLLFNSALSAQNIEKMNKSELREHIVILTTKIDSLKNANFYLEQSISVENKEDFELILKNENEKKQIISENENERKRIISENEIEISKLNEIIIYLKGSIPTSIWTSDKNDFLNKYYFDQIPLPNNSFSLVLSKLVYGEKKSNNNNSYDNDNGYDNDNSYDNDVYKGAVERLPEILDPNKFTYWGVNPNVKITYGTNLNNYVISKNSDYFNSKLPKIEILKNKLFTIKYNDGSEESFLFNVKQMKSGDNNNQRKILQIELANEAVKADGSNNTAKDIVWRFFAIENECYLALTLGQLNRLNLKLISVDDEGLGLEVQNNFTELHYLKTSYDFKNCYKCITTGGEIYLSRNKDLFMESSKYINPKDIIYLFKLK